MIKENFIQMPLQEAIDAGKDKDGNVVKIPIIESIQEINGELFAVVESYENPPELEPAYKSSIKH